MSEYEFLDALADEMGMVFLYLTIALAAIIMILGVLIYFFRKENIDTFKKSAIGICAGYALVVTVVMTYLKIKTNSINPDFEQDLLSAYLFKPILSIILIAVCGALLMLAVSIFNKKAVKYAGFAVLIAELGAFIATMVLMTRYYNEAGIPQEFESMNTVGLIVSAVIVMALIAGFYIIGNSTKGQNNTRALVYGAVSIAMSFALSYIRLFKLPQGGSVTFASLLPLIVYCCMFGTRRGLTACIIYGVLQAVQDPWIIHPMQFLLDYPLAFGLIGISGIFMEKGLFKKHKIAAFLLGSVLGVTLRFSCHVISGVFAFADWADLETYGSVAAYSMAYNSFAFIDMAITLAAGSALFASKAFTAQMAQSAEGGDIFTRRSKPNAFVENIDSENEEDNEADNAVVRIGSSSGSGNDGIDDKKIESIKNNEKR